MIHAHKRVLHSKLTQSMKSISWKEFFFFNLTFLLQHLAKIKILFFKDFSVRGAGVNGDLFKDKLEKMNRFFLSNLFI